ncbi:hypothetical protein DNAM_640 [Pseudomonas phage BroderSalsa]|nr:hypothetical protein DNAM_640 [Pseudomonas phage BroderSalsa]
MQLSDFVSCCTGHILSGMGQTTTGDWGSQRHNMERNDLQFAIAVRQKQLTVTRHAFITCAINNEQKQANRVLLKMGWKPSKWMSKIQHHNTKVRVFTWAVMDGVKTEYELEKLFPVK